MSEELIEIELKDAEVYQINLALNELKVINRVQGGLWYDILKMQNSFKPTVEIIDSLVKEFTDKGFKPEEIEEKINLTIKDNVSKYSFKPLKIDDLKEIKANFDLLFKILKVE